MKKQILLIAGSIILLGVFILSTIPVEANTSLPQAVVQTPTADANGRIVYKVKSGDNCVRLELIYGVKVQTIIELNNLDQNCTLAEGMDLVLGIYERPTAAATTTATPGQQLPTPTAYNGNGKICIYLFFDTNGDTQPEENEPPIEKGAFNIQDKNNTINENGETELTAACKEVPEGEYNISVAPPEGFNPTTNMNYTLKIQAGDTQTIPFGAQPNSVSGGQTTAGETNNNPTQQSSSNEGIWLLLAGLVLILSGIGLGVYFVFISRKNNIL